MPLFDERHGRLTFKIVFWGPGQGGKTTALRGLHASAPEALRGELVSLATGTARTLFFDFLPVQVGVVPGIGHPVRLDLFTVPGQVFYRDARSIVLRGADGLVFVADSREERETANVEAVRELERTLGEQGGDSVPLVFVYNKRDVPNALPLRRLREVLNTRGCPEFEAVASEGVGLSEALGALCDLVVSRHQDPGRG